MVRVTMMMRVPSPSEWEGVGMGAVADMIEMLRLKLAQIEARLALKRKERKVMQQKQMENKGELSALQVPASPQKSPPKRILPRLPSRYSLPRFYS